MKQYPSSNLGQFTTLGIEVGLSVVFGLLGGWWIDEKLGTSPWITLLGTGFGMATAGRALVRAARQAHRMAEQEEALAREARRKFLNDRRP